MPWEPLCEPSRAAPTPLRRRRRIWTTPACGTVTPMSPARTRGSTTPTRCLPGARTRRPGSRGGGSNRARLGGGARGIGAEGKATAGVHSLLWCSAAFARWKAATLAYMSRDTKMPTKRSALMVSTCVSTSRPLRGGEMPAERAARSHASKPEGSAKRPRSAPYTTSRATASGVARAAPAERCAVSSGLVRFSWAKPGVSVSGG
mmetsp:Transcript_10068/g.34286  ORF Transcript_10068/g.34286 Transcript_10068/m.34286 type:complete len:204 (+) Transcript_10068:1691-2302(+)